jgi:peptidoglycan/LPS O-acetylase OafA/YrhL
VQETRFVSLDAWRGVCALLVALFHLQAYSHIYNVSLIRHSFLFVDFFFVLSGFVITASYREKILSGFSPWQFMILRVGRIYPLHIAVLGILVALEVLRFAFDGTLGGTSDKFTGEHSVPSIFSNLLLIQSLGVHKMLTWNLPSWTISVEFYTYAVFAFALLALRRRFYLFVALIIFLAPIILFVCVGTIDTDFDFGIVRCLFGFFLGIVCFDLSRLAATKSLFNSNRVMSLMEILVVGALVSFVCFFGSGYSTLAAPLVFSFAVVAFSLERGVVSRSLKTKPFVFLGNISYSIYMVHMLVLIGLTYLFQISERYFGFALRQHGYFGANLWQGDASYVLFIVLVLVTASLTFSFIEQPGRYNSRKFADRLFKTDGKPLKNERNELIGFTNSGFGSQTVVARTTSPLVGHTFSEHNP